MSKIQENEEKLWQSFKKGDKAAFSFIFKKYYPLLHNYGIKLSRDNALTEDCLQDFFIYLYDHRRKLKDLQFLKPYLFKAFRNNLIKVINQNKKTVSFDKREIEDFQFEFSLEDVWIEEEEAKEKKALVFQLLNKLTNRQRELLYLKYYSNSSISEIADILSISYQGVLNGISKALKKLKKD